MMHIKAMFCCLHKLFKILILSYLKSSDPLDLWGIIIIIATLDEVKKRNSNSTFLFNVKNALKETMILLTSTLQNSRMSFFLLGENDTSSEKPISILF